MDDIPKGLKLYHAKRKEIIENYDKKAKETETLNVAAMAISGYQPLTDKQFDYIMYNIYNREYIEEKLSTPVQCPVCKCTYTRIDHEKVCKRLNGLHIREHNSIVEVTKNMIFSKF